MYRLDELTARFGGELCGDGAARIGRVAPLDVAVSGDIAFLANPKYVSHLAGCAATAVILGPAARDRTDLPRIVTSDPYLYFARVANLLNPPARPTAGIHPGATVLGKVAESASVGPGVFVGEGAVIGDRVVLGAGASIGPGCLIGADTLVHARATIYDHCVIGERCIVHSGAVIGADGFGFAREKDGSWFKIPQTGRVVIGADVEVGANTTIDRGAMQDTVIENGVKLDNQIQIAHNVHIGEHTAIAGCVGIAGSTRIGRRCMIGGQAGIIGHLEICDDVIVSAGTLVSKSIRKPGIYTASLPLQGHAEWVRNFAHLRHLDALSERVRSLEQAAKINDKAKP
jgi:UDP-3-O-[3-hydroxymyristoyl] glucosamine N-acyltransferase